MGCKDSKSASASRPNEVEHAPALLENDYHRELLEGSHVGIIPKNSGSRDSGTDNLASIEEGVELKVADQPREHTDVSFPGDLEFGKITSGSDSRSTDCSETSYPHRDKQDRRLVSSNIQDAGSMVSGTTPLESKASCGCLQLSRRKRTSAVQANERDCMIVHYACWEDVDESSRTKVKEASWTAVVGADATPIKIALRVSESPDSRRRVCITCDEEVVLSEDADDFDSEATFEHAWTFTGHIREVHEPNIYEFRPEGVGAPQAWYPATLTCLRDDGTYDLVVLMSEADGTLKEVSFTAVEKTQIRRKGANRCSFSGPPASPWRFLRLEVPRCDPMQAVLSIDGSQMVTHYFARVSPPHPRPLADWPRSQAVSSTALPSIEMTVDKDRQLVYANAGHSLFKHFISGEARSIASDKHRQRCRWTFQLGPFAEHTVEIEKRHHTSKIVSLSVDDTVLVEASPEGLDCDDDGWECHFFLVGERALNFKVFEVDCSGIPLTTTGDVAQVAKYTHTCHVKLPDDSDLTKAVLSIDEIDFAHLPAKVDSSAEKHLSMDLHSLWTAYNILVPYKLAEGDCRANSINVDDEVLGEHVAGCCSLLVCEKRKAAANLQIANSPTTSKRKKKICCSA